MSQTLSIHVLLVDDHDANSPGLMPFFRTYDDLRLLGRAANDQEAIEMCQQHKPHVVLLDLKRPEIDCAPLVQRIKALHPRTEVVILTNSTCQTLSNETLAAGAAAVITKSLSIDNLADAIRVAASFAPSAPG